MERLTPHGSGDTVVTAMWTGQLLEPDWTFDLFVETTQITLGAGSVYADGGIGYMAFIYHGQRGL